MKKIILLVICFYCTGLLHAQDITVKGTITDTVSRQNLSNTVILLLNPKDSLLYKFTRSDAKGYFELNNIRRGSYLLIASYPGYADYVEHLTIKDSSSPYTIGVIAMTSKAHLLQEVVVHSQVSAIKIKGDTTEYTADSFKVQPNATVEELLKKLPGIQVDRNGQITAQGVRVQKVLVDGEEFFGDDPTLVTQNLRANMVNKVQLYDKKSDQAAFTGIDDGQKIKTINLKLKEDKKNGYFGKVDAGGATDGYFNSQAMINIFKKKMKFAAYGIASNTGKTGLTGNENDNYGRVNEANDYDAGGNLIEGFNNNDLDTWNGSFTGQGSPLVQTGGVHYNNKWDDDKQSINGNYKILQLMENGQSQTNTEYILPDTIYYNDQTQIFHNTILRNKLNGSYELQIDSTSSIKIMADGGTDHKSTNNVFYSDARASDGSFVNQSNRITSTNGDDRNVNSNIFWKKKLKKEGRTISVNAREVYINGQSTGYLFSDNKFYGTIPDSITDQYKTYNNNGISFNTKVTYSEPLSKVSSLIFNYNIATNNSSSQRNSFNKDGNQKYSLLDSVYSNDYSFNVITNKTGAAYSLFTKKFRMNFGSDVGFTNFNQRNKISGSVLNRSFVNWYPNAYFNYAFSNFKYILLEYTGNTQQPTIQQLQPILTNEDPLNITIGNPELKPAFNNNLVFRFFNYKLIANSFLQFVVNYNFTNNQIGNKNYVDSLGRQITQSVNLNGNRYFSGNLDYGSKIKKIDMNIGVDAGVNLGRYISIVNNELNITNSNNYTGKLSIDKYKEGKYAFNVSGAATYTNSSSSIQQDIKTQYWIFDIRPAGDLFFPLKFQLHSDADFSFRQKTSTFDQNTNVILWNAWLGKKFLKNDALLLKVSGNDLLNQNNGFNRNVSSNFITQNTYNTIKRYFMFSIVWNFNKMAANK